MVDKDDAKVCVKCGATDARILESDGHTLKRVCLKCFGKDHPQSLPNLNINKIGGTNSEQGRSD